MSAIQAIQNKIADWDYAHQLCNTWKQSGETIVFTNVRFDILHYGHFHYLAEASDLGDRLIIGLNSADSIKRLKGKNRPIHDEKSRQFLLAALEFIDLVVVFEEDTPLNLIRNLKPDLLVKGGDYDVEAIVGYDDMISWGGLVQTLPFVDGYSTTKIEEQIRSW